MNSEMALQIIREASVSDRIDNESVGIITESLERLFASMEVIKGVPLTEEAVRLYKTDDDQYYIELAELYKYSKDNKMSMLEALNKLGDYYNSEGQNITADNFFVGIYESDYSNELSFSRKGDSSAAIVIRTTLEAMNDLKSNGINMKILE